MPAARGWQLVILVALVGAGTLGARAARAEEVAASRWYEEVTLNGFFSTSYSYNFGHPATGTNAYRVFDVDDNTFKLDVVELVLQRAVANPRDAGFRVDLAMGGSIPRVTAAAGLFRESLAVPGEDVDLQQGFVSWIAPLGAGLRLDAGKFVTHHGTEVIEGYDGWNDDATRSFLFGFAIPFTHTGVRASYPFTPQVSGMVMVVNGWDNATDNNRSKTLGAQLARINPEGLTVYLNGMLGPEQDGNDSDLRGLLDGAVSLKVHPSVTLGLNLDWGTEEGLVPPAAPGGSAGSAEWSGAAGYVRWQVRGAFAMIVRAESFNDRDGVRTGVPQTLSEATLTPELRVSPRFVLRADLRADRSTEDVFLDGSDPADHQTTILLNALAWF